MCIAQDFGYKELDSPYKGYQIQEAAEGEELTMEQKEKNWALGGQSYEEAFGEKWGAGSKTRGRGPGSMVDRLADIHLQARRNEIRKGYNPVRRPAPSAPMQMDEQDPGQGYSIKGKSTQDDVRSEKYNKQSLKVGSVKKGTKKLKAIDAASLPTSTSDKSGLNI